MLAKIRQFVEEYADELFLITILLLVAVIGFGMGRLSATNSTSSELIIESMPVNVEQMVQAIKAPLAEQGSSEPTQIVGNKNSKIYHRSDCSGAKRMSEANRVYFASIAAAKQAGYQPAGNCPGLE